MYGTVFVLGAWLVFGDENAAFSSFDPEHYRENRIGNIFWQGDATAIVECGAGSFDAGISTWTETHSFRHPARGSGT